MGREFLSYYVFLLGLIIAVCCVANTSNAQSGPTTSDILRSYLLMESDLPYSDNISFLKNNAKGLPVVEGFQFRTETDEFSFDQQEYSLRFNMNSRRERKAYEKVLSSNTDIYSLKQEEYIIERMTDVYQGLIDYYFETQKLEIVKSNLLILKDRKQVLSKLIANSDKVNVNNWLSNQNDIIDEYTDSLSLELSKAKIQKRILGNNELTAEIRFEDLISVEKVKEIIGKHLANTEVTTAVKLASAEEQNAKAEFEMELAETGKMIDFFQLKYQSDQDVSFQKELSFGSSINLPTKSTNRAKKNKAALEVWDKNNEKVLEQEKANSRIYSSVFNFYSAIKKYESLKKTIRDQRLEETYAEYKKLGNVSPLTLLKLNENIKRFEMMLLEEKENIYQAYIDILGESSRYAKSPFVNYLSDNLRLVD